MEDDSFKVYNTKKAFFHVRLLVVEFFLVFVIDTHINTQGKYSTQY